MTGPKFTRADLPDLRALRATPLVPDDSVMARALDLAIAQAEADRPPLPDEPVLIYTDPDDGASGLRWQKGGKAGVWRWADGVLTAPYTPTDPENYTPYRPTITNAQVEAAAEARFADMGPGCTWGEATERWRDRQLSAMASAFRAAGFPIEGIEGDE